MFFMLFYYIFRISNISASKIMFSVKFCEFCFLPEFCEFLLFSVSWKTGDFILTTSSDISNEITACQKTRYASSPRSGMPYHKFGFVSSLVYTSA